MIITLFILALLSERTVSKALNNSLSLTPSMGWNPFNVFGCDTDEADYRAAAGALVKSGLKDIGYKYLNMDCGWQSTQREQAQITWNATRITSGMQALGQYIISLGLQFGLYSDAGFISCDLAGGSKGWIGSAYYEQDDASTFKSWGATYLKYDNCYVGNGTVYMDFDPTDVNEEVLFSKYMGAVLENDTTHHVVYSINEWGIQDPARWTSNVANSWTITNSVGPSFADLQRVINALVPVTGFSGPGGWNDLDLLQVGNAGLTEAEWQTNFAFWAAAKSPLLISTDLTTISDEVLSILSNKFLIAVNQDPLGQSIAFMRRYTDDYDVWSGNLQDGSKVAVLLNWQDTSRSLTFNLSDVGLVSADLTNLWDGTALGAVEASHTTTVDAHGTLVYKLTKGVSATPYEFTTYFANATQNELAGGASLKEFTSGNWVANNIGLQGTLTFTGISGGTKGGTKLIRITYINGDHTFFNSDCSNCRRVDVSVNGGQSVAVEMPISAMNWDILSAPYLLSLNGFVPGANNTVTFSNSNAWAPDIFTLEVER